MATNTYVALATQTLASPAASVTFSSIPQGYTDLVVVTQYPFVSTGVRYATYQVGNGTVDTGTNYSNTYLDTYPGSPNSGRSANLTFGLFSYSSSAGLSTSQTQFGMMHFMNYSNTTTFKTTLSRNMSAGDMTSLYGNLWRSTAAINIITITSGGANFATGSTFSIYGIKAQAIGTAKATGGTITYDAYGNVIHTFTGNGTFTPTQNFTAEYFVLAGGGGAQIGGGGAGGLLNSSSSFISGTGYSVTIGAGGAGQTSGGTDNATNGVDSVFSTFTAIGGGKGGGVLGTNETRDGVTGGSGGGGGNAAGAGTSGQGFAGGNSPSTGACAGGGGAGSAGVNHTVVNTGSAGGSGIDSVITGSSVNYAAGGGGGGSSAGGAAGGASAGNGVTTGTPGSGATNRGGGGGGNWFTNTGGAGGSGIVVIKYSGV